MTGKNPKNPKNPKGAGRKPSPNPLTKKASIYLLPREYDILKELAAQRETSLNNLIRGLLAPYIDN
jgi:hypothetical protein